MSAADSIPIIDLRLLSYSDLQTLTLTSSSFNLDSLSDVSPTIDRSIFNESAATRKQTFSRLPLSPQNPNPNPNPRRRGRPRLHPNAQNPSPNPNVVEDVGRKENLRIVDILKKLFETREKGENFERIDKEVRNGKGEAVDIVELGKKDDLFGEEIRRRTEGLKTEEQLLGYMTGLDGQWGSRRKRRKAVDASVFGDGALPKGWKVLLGLKRKDGIVYLNCRRYVSPSGKQFTSCKEVSSYILSLNGQQDALQPAYCQHDNHASRMKSTAGSVMGPVHQDDNTKDIANCSFLTPISFDLAECDKRGQFFGVKRAAPENSMERCKSNLTFGYKDTHSGHLSTFHKSAKRHKLGKSLTDGVIVKDGKYECQFCHKSFIERRRYNGHIGAHIRYEFLGVDGLPISTSSTSSDPSSLAVVPHIPSDMNIPVSESQEADNTKSDNNQIHIDSSQCMLDIETKEIEHNSNSGAPEIIEAVTDSCKKEIEHCPKLSAPETTEGVSSGKSIGNKIEDCKTTCDDDKEIIKDKNVTDITSHSGSVISPNEIDVNNMSHASLPVITQEASTSKYVHGPINNSELTGDKSGVIQDTNAQYVKSSMCLDDVSSLLTVNENSISPSHNKATNGDISERTMVGCESKNSADTGNTTSTEIAGEIGHFSSKDEFVDAEINVCDITGYKSEVADVADIMSIEANACNDALSPSLINVDNTTNENANGIDPASCSVISSTENCNGQQKVCDEHHLLSLSDNCNGQQKVCDEHHLLSLSDNGRSYDLEAYESDFFTSKVNEPMGLDTSMHDKSDTASCHAITNGNTGIASTMHNELNATCIFPHIANEPTSGIETNADCMFPGDMSKSLLDGIDRVSYEFQDYFHSNNVCNEDATGVTGNNGDDGQSFQVNTSDQSSSWMHPSDSIPFFDLITDQCQNELRGSDPRNEQANAAGFDELRLGSIEPSNFVLFTGQSSGSVTRSPMELFPDDQLEWGMALTKMPTNSVSTSVCVWCGREFILEGVETEPQSESLGYICPDCKARISGQFGMLNDGYS